MADSDDKVTNALRRLQEVASTLTWQTEIGLKESSAQDDEWVDLLGESIYGLAERVRSLQTSIARVLAAPSAADAFVLASQLQLIDSPNPSALITVDAYLDTESEHTAKEVEAALLATLEWAGIALALKGVDEWGSWRKRLAGWAIDKNATDNILGAVETAYLRVPQSRAKNFNNASAVAQLLSALAPVANGALRVGSLLVLKVTADGDANVVTLELNEVQMRLLADNPSWMTSPRTLAENLGSKDEGRALGSPAPLDAID